MSGTAAIICPCGWFVGLTMTRDYEPSHWSVIDPVDPPTWDELRDHVTLLLLGDKDAIDGYITCRCGQTYHAVPEPPFIVPAKSPSRKLRR